MQNIPHSDQILISHWKLWVPVLFWCLWRLLLAAIVQLAGSSSWLWFVAQCLAHSGLSLLFLLPGKGQPWAVCPRVLSEAPICVHILGSFSVLLWKPYGKRLNCLCMLLAQSSKQSFLFWTGNRAERPGSQSGRCTTGLKAGQLILSKWQPY